MDVCAWEVKRGGGFGSSTGRSQLGDGEFEKWARRGGQPGGGGWYGVVWDAMGRHGYGGSEQHSCSNARCKEPVGVLSEAV